MNVKSIIEKALEQGKGVVRLAPNWVPRSFCRPGRRLRLHPDDYYALGLVRGGIDERWFSSTVRADNGPLTPEDEGLSYIVADEEGKEKATLLEAVELFKDGIIGSFLWDKYGEWPVYSKFFDNLGPLPHHIHHSEEFAQRVGMHGKPEMYFFPAQMNNYPGEFAYTFFGLNPGTTREQLRACLENFTKGDNQLLEISHAHKLMVDTGWDVPPGVLHAPGSLCTYEPQFASDVFAMYQSVLLGGHCLTEDMLWKNCPPEELGNIDYLMDVVDWDLNLDPDFVSNRFMTPVVIEQNPQYTSEWICYRSKVACAKRLTVQPGAEVTIKDGGCYGFITLQGHGTINGMPVESPSMIRYGQLTHDEYFVTHQAATEGVVIKNLSPSEPLVMLKHFAESPERDAFFGN